MRDLRINANNARMGMSKSLNGVAARRYDGRINGIPSGVDRQRESTGTGV